jgi:hypothetical protein
MEQTAFNPTQMYLLQLFSFSRTEETKKELQDILTSYYKQKVSVRASEIWEKMGLDQQKLDEMCSIHERLPYE